MAVGGVSLQDWVYIVTIVYVLIQTAHIVWKWWAKERRAP